MQQLKLKLSNGDVTIKLLPDIAPKHVARIVELVNSGFYNGLGFHKVIPDFMAQTGCPNGDGTGRSGQTINAELSNIEFEKGSVGMARGLDINSADCQFFICLKKSSHLKNKYTLFGQVTSGMEYIEALKQGNEFTGIIDETPDKITSAEIL